MLSEAGTDLRQPFAAALALLALAVATPLALRSEPPTLGGGADQAPPAAGERARDASGKLPLSFIPNKGQTDRSVRYYARAGGAGFYFTRKKAVLAFQGKDKGAALELRFLGASPNAELAPGRPLEGKVNYIKGADPSKWQRNVSTYAALRYRELWPGIDMVFRGNGGKLKYEFVVRPGANPSNIRLAYGGAQGLSLGAAGTLLIDTPVGVLRDSPPRSYQRLNGRRAAVESRFVPAERGNAYGFNLGAYDPSRRLVIDPGLVYSTYLGGNQFDVGRAIAVDTQGNTYVTGGTGSLDFPTTAGAFDTSLNSDRDAYVTKLNSSGSGLAYSTYLGGPQPPGGGGTDFGDAIAVDGSGSAYVTGETFSSEFPTTTGAADTSFNGSAEAYAPSSPRTGPASPTRPTSVEAVSTKGGASPWTPAGAPTVTGETETPASFRPPLAPTTHPARAAPIAFVTKLNPSGSALVYSTYLGGSGDDNLFDVGSIRAGCPGQRLRDRADSFR